jgi:hypothetical protein
MRSELCAALDTPTSTNSAGRCERQRTKDDASNGAVHRDRRAESDRQHADGDERHPRCSIDRSQAEADVGPQRIHQLASSREVRVFFHMRLPATKSSLHTTTTATPVSTSVTAHTRSKLIHARRPSVGLHGHRRQLPAPP